MSNSNSGYNVNDHNKLMNQIQSITFPQNMSEVEIDKINKLKDKIQNMVPTETIIRLDSQDFLDFLEDLTMDQKEKKLNERYDICLT